MCDPGPDHNQKWHTSNSNVFFFFTIKRVRFHHGLKPFDKIHEKSMIIFKKKENMHMDQEIIIKDSNRTGAQYSFLESCVSKNHQAGPVSGFRPGPGPKLTQLSLFFKPWTTFLQTCVGGTSLHANVKTFSYISGSRKPTWTYFFYLGAHRDAALPLW